MTAARRVLLGLLLTACLGTCVRDARAQALDTMSLDRWAKLREAERYQLNVAEKYWAQKNWKVALDEYEKFLTLYERSEGASYAQLKWSLCQVHLKKLNTAIKDGFQTVVDYWPDSPEAVASAFYIARQYKDMGEVAKAKKAYGVVLQKHAKHTVAAYSLADLIDLTTIDDDLPTRVQLWKRLAFEGPRNAATQNLCNSAASSLASHLCATGQLDDAIAALKTVPAYDQRLTYYVGTHALPVVAAQCADEKQRAAGEKLADAAIAFFREHTPTDTADPAKKALALECWYHVADAHSAARRDEKVLETYEKIEKSFGPDDTILGRLAGWFKGRNRFDDARKTYARYQDVAAGRAQTALSWREQGKVDEAVAVYRLLEASDAANAVKWMGEIASTYRGGKKYKEAIATYERLVAADSEKAGSWRYQMASCYHEAGQYKEAIGHYRQCDNFPTNYVQMADCHRHLKEYKEAILLYNQVGGGSEAQAPWAWYQVGRTYEDAGQKENAIKAFQQVCKLYPTNTYAAQAHALLQSKYNITITLGGAKNE